MRILVQTVGGSVAPIIKSILNYRPDYTVFICTEDSEGNKGSKDMVYSADYDESIVKQTKLSEDKYGIEIVPHDDPYESYRISFNLMKQYLDENNEVIADYTGGTKSMSVGLGAAAMELPNCCLSVVKGKRLDLIHIKDGMERVARLPANVVFIQKQKILCQNLIQKWNFQAAVKILESIDIMGHNGDDSEFERLLILSRGFADWDKFNYREAVKKIDVFKNDPKVEPYNKIIKQICATLKWHEEWSPDKKSYPPVFVLAYDVLLNAERKAANANYDDAISRIYRTLEMYGQLCLRTGNPQLTSDNIDVSLLPEDKKAYYGNKRGYNNKIQVGLKACYDLLADLEHPLKPVWNKCKQKIEDSLAKRNYSFLAHGMKPLTQKDYDDIKEIVWDFIIKCDEAQGIKKGLAEARQFPREV